MEGFTPVDSCPYQSTQSKDELEPLLSEADFVTLRDGEALDELEASAVARADRTKLIVIAGPKRSGKTTILTSLFDSFQEAPFANFHFAGSKTLVGFERRCHESRVSSGRTKADTKRTVVKDSVDYLHLRLKETAHPQGPAFSLLLTDISGERYKAMRDSSDAVASAPMLKRADHLCVVIDGARLVDIKQRHTASNDARSLIRSLVEATALKSSCEIQVVFTMWDLVVTDDRAEDVSNFIEQMKASITALVTPSNLSLCFLELAARPESPKLPFAHGLPTLLRKWHGEEKKPDRFAINVLRSRSTERQIVRFADLTLIAAGGEVNVCRI